MSEFKKLTHTIYNCKYQIVFCSKYQYKMLKDEIAEYTRQQIDQLCHEKDMVEILEPNIQRDHIQDNDYQATSSGGGR